ncbi:aldehyde dehydrogenase-like protein [Cucurbitaria berberidis CBS 394.84]|uniref:aldehyde dehydrogenase (NAD(+)) n=1 Tax=Cucurbitaria berberidis CBS 394.84 TaxID=1168544 RepID=A0A9P4L833_9PLEO|nr:aldehyde dehydrogenase-like protein [Cucurbitaria berberidis CBS 394.84]KAF1844823.1 aldehyde dehydrogenase-like protein [Cucurbitaria berberidis CBS 394.84]
MSVPDKIETRLFINGEFVEASDGKTFDIINPATLKHVAKVHEASEQDTDRAVAAAKAAFSAWSALSPDKRAPYFKKLASLIRENNAELGALEAASMGKPLGAFFDAYACASKWDHYAEAGYTVQGTSSVQTPGFLNLTLRQPYGVVAAIIPWNVPLLFLAGKLAPALIVGNTVVLKSSEKAPLTSAKIATLVQQAGFPPGVINIISGFGNVSGSILSHHMDVRALTFTGSGRTGRIIQAAAAKSNLKQVFLELGGKSPAIVFEDANIEEAVKETAYSIQWNSGQVCMANSRVYVQDTIADKYIELFRQHFEKEVSMGDPLDKGINHGPQADEVQHKTVLQYLESGKQSGGELLIGGAAPSDREGYYIQPTIFKNTPEDAKIMKEEVFGPVVNINVFKSEEEVLAKANNTEYGLYAAVYTKNIDRAIRFAKGLEAGTVGVNCTSPITGRDMPFGGYKSSGSGREGEPLYSLDNFLETKSFPGPCRYCARTGATCTIATPRRKRPYYHVTEEEYQCAMRILEHFFPGHDLNLQSLRSIAKAIKDGTFTAPPVLQTEGLFTNNLASPPDDEESVDDGEEQDVSELHEPLGCMMKDSRGKFRYVGAHSEIPFNAAVVTLGIQRKNPAIIPSPRVGLYPPPLPGRSPATDFGAEEVYYLPARELCDIYVSRFLEDVHCTYWLYAVESLLRRVDSTYSDAAPARSSSWMCSLYAIFAIGAANYVGTNGESPLPGSPAAMDPKTSEDYITLAKQLIPTVYDEADIDSIRALAIMSIVMENICSRVSAYLYMGASVQMAYTLGLHRDQIAEFETTIERERNRRIWWTLFILDHGISSRGGSPSVIDERYTKVTTPMSSEQTLYPGLHTPLSWLSTSVALCRLKREITQAVYTERSSHSISFSTVSESLLLLQKWYRQMPAHLKYDVPSPPTHKRAVSLLHLNYWGTTILLTRPFLLYLVIKYTTLASSKKIWFERMGKTCIDAAQKSITILQQMAADGTLSSLTAFDSTCILRLVMVFILAYAHTRMPQYSSHIETLISLSRGMEQIGFTKMVTEETPGRLADLGIPEEPQPPNGNGNVDAPVHLNDEMIAQLWGNWDPNFMTPLQVQQSLDLTFDDSGAFDMNSEILAFTNLDDSIIIDPSQVYGNYHQHH